MTAGRPDAFAAERGRWIEEREDGTHVEHRVDLVGCSMCGWEDLSWPDENQDRIREHMEGNHVWMFMMSGPQPPLSMNDRMHWGKKSKITRAIREEAAWKVRAQKIPPLKRCQVQVTWFVADARRRDEDNPAPSAKAVYDGLVDAGVVPDDTPEYMEKPAVKIVNRGFRAWSVTVRELPMEAA